MKKRRIPAGEVQEFWERVDHLRKQLGLTLRALANRSGVLENYLTKAFKWEQYGYSTPNLTITRRLARGLNVPVGALTGDAESEGSSRPRQNFVFDPTCDHPATLFNQLVPHDERAAFGIGLFSSLPCAVSNRGILDHIHKRYFGGFGDYADRLTGVFDEIAANFINEYHELGPEYGGFDQTCLICDWDLHRMICAEDEFAGISRDVVGETLEKLHDAVRRGFRLGIVSREKIPGTMLYRLAGLDSLIAIGDGVTVRRRLATYDIELRQHSQEQEADLVTLQYLEQHCLCHDLTPKGTAVAVERLLSKMEEPPKQKNSNQEKTRLMDGFGDSEDSD